MMRRVLSIAAILAVGGSLWAQSLAELSRQEKARRERLEGKRARVVTNADLALVRKTPAIISSQDDSSGPAPPAEKTTISNEPEARRSNPSPIIRTIPTVSEPGPPLFKDPGAKGGVTTSGGTLESRLKASQELIGLLTTKLAALMQELDGLDSMAPKEALLRQIEETKQKLSKAEEEGKRLQQVLESSQREN